MVASSDESAGHLNPANSCPKATFGFKDLVQNADGSVTVHFAPEAPKGAEGNWVQTVNGKGYNVIFRVYGPTETWFDGTWKPGDFQETK